MKPIPVILSVLLLFSGACVGPIEPDDGLIENLPAMVNTATEFAFNLKGNAYEFDETHTLALKVDTAGVLKTVLLVTGIPASGTDTCFITLKKQQDTLRLFQIRKSGLYVNLNPPAGPFELHTGLLVRADSAKVFAPDRVNIRSRGFSGTMEFILAK